MKLKGNPSGNPMTMIFNSWCSIYLLMLYYYSAVTVDYRDFNLFFKYVVFFVLGDDSLFAVDPLVFDEGRFVAAIKHVASVVGMEVTSASKVDDFFFKPIMECVFLQRRFRDAGRLIVPCLNIISIHAMLQWVTKSKYATRKESTLVNIDTALRYLYF